MYYLWYYYNIHTSLTFWLGLWRYLRKLHKTWKRNKKETSQPFVMHKKMSTLEDKFTVCASPLMFLVTRITDSSQTQHTIKHSKETPLKSRLQRNCTAGCSLLHACIATTETPHLLMPLFLTSHSSILAALPHPSGKAETHTISG